MKTTYIKYLLLTFCVISLTSCIKDLGNYDYTPAEELMPVVISGYSDTTVMIGTVLEIAPELENVDKDNEDRYVYTWYAYVKQAQGVVPGRDTISTERNLSERIVLQPGNYNLIYEVKDPKLGIFVSKTTSLTVTGTTITSGWYVMKEVGENETDVDYVNNDGELTNDILNDILSREDTVNRPVLPFNRRLKGKPLMMGSLSRFFHGTYNSTTGRVSYTIYPSIIFASTNDFAIVGAASMNVFRDYENSFYEMPEVKEIQNFFISTAGMPNYYLINKANDVSITGAPEIHAKVYVMGTMSSNVGRYSLPMEVAVDGYSNYDLYKDGVPDGSSLFTYDKTSRRFVFVSASSISLMADHNNPNLLTREELKSYDLVWMLAKTTASGYALLRSTSDNNVYKLGKIGYAAAPEFAFSTFVDVPAGARMLQADVLASPQSASCVYFAKGNKLSYFSESGDLDLSQREKDIYTFPSDETVSYIGNLASTHLTVLTNNASGWKLYNFPIVGAGTSSDIEPTPELIGSGAGVGRYVMKR